MAASASSPSSSTTLPLSSFAALLNFANAFSLQSKSCCANMMLAKGPKVNKIPRSNGSAPPPVHSGNTAAMTSNFDDVPLPKGVGAEGGPATFEELLLRSLAKEGGSQSGGIGGQTRSMPRPTATQHSPISKSAQRPSLPAQMARTSNASSNEPENRLSMSFQSVRSSSEYDDSSRVSYEAKNQMRPLPFTSPEAARTQQPRAYELIGSRLDQTQDEELEEFQHLEQQLMNESAMGRQVLMQAPAAQRLSSATRSSAASLQPAGQHLENATTLRSFNVGSLDGGDGADEQVQRAAVRATAAASTFTRRPATAAPSMRSHASAAPAIRTAASEPNDSASSDDDEGSAAPGSDLVSKMWGKQSRKALQGQVASLKEQLSAANAQRKEMEQRCLSLEDDAASVKAELMRAKRTVRDLEQQREQLSSNREDVASLVASARKEIEAEKIAEVRKAKKMQEAAEHRARVSDIAVGELKQQVQTLSAQLDEVKGSSRERESRLKGNADSLKSQVEVLRQRNEDLQQQLQIAEGQLLASTHHAASKSAANASGAARSGARQAEPAAAAPSSPMKTNGKSASLGLQDSFRPNSSQGMSNSDESRGQYLRPSSAMNTAMNELPPKLEQPSPQDDEEREIVHSDGKRELHRRDGSKTILFPSGHRKEIRTDGSTEVHFPPYTLRDASRHTLCVMLLCVT
jgi:hypothetical protein